MRKTSGLLACLLFGASLPSLAAAQDSAPAPAAPPAEAPAAETSTPPGDAAAPAPEVAAAPAPATPVAAPAAETPPESDADLAAFLAADPAADAAAITPPAEDMLRLYGFVDFGVSALYFARESLLSDTITYRDPTFVFGNLNLYLDARPDPDWHALAEIRVSLYPLGTPVVSGTTITYTDTRVFDETSSTGRNQVAWSGIILERAYAEWTHFDFFRVRAGYILTPYGIWNVDHGTPVLLGLILPSFFAREYFPLRQTGVQIYGNVTLGPGDLAYTAYVSNGRTQGQFDFDADKAIGGRVAYSITRPFRLTIGGSFYFGDSERYEKTFAMRDGMVRYDTTFTSRSNDWALAADVSLEYEWFGLRSELVVQDLRYVNGARPINPFAGPGAYTPDSRFYDFYIAPFVRFGPFTPYVWYEYTRGELSGDSNVRMLYSVGLNIEFAPSVQLKTQAGYYAFYRMEDGTIPEPTSDRNFFIFQSRLVVAF